VAHYRYLIVGGGMTADAAARAIREIDPAGPIGVVAAEPDPPYNRPPLSKALWKGEPEDSVWRDTAAAGVTLHLGRRAVELDPPAKRVRDDGGATHTFDKLLLATGGAPRRLAQGADDVIYFRTIADYRRLRALVARPARCAVIGGGFIGSEIAAALRLQGREVVMLVPEAGLGARVFPADLGAFLVQYYRDHGVEVRTGEGVAGVGRRNGKTVLHTTAARDVPADVVVAGLGIEPNVDLARRAGLLVDHGIVVDAACRTSHPDVYAAGDVANFHNPALDMRLRVEHEDNANTMGLVAGRNMAGHATPYDHLPFFYSDLFDLGYEAVGDTDPRHDVVADWKTPFREGVIYYLRDGRVRGVLLWNTWGQVEAARALIAAPGPFRPGDLKGRIAG
jgi:3-phenylpropionate/trans-cinnamate dioxygenase ferredoxin reductase component